VRAAISQENQDNEPSWTLSRRPLVNRFQPVILRPGLGRQTPQPRTRAKAVASRVDRNDELSTPRRLESCRTTVESRKPADANSIATDSALQNQI